MEDGRNQFPYLGAGELHLKSSTVGDRWDRWDTCFINFYLKYNNIRPLKGTFFKISKHLYIEKVSHLSPITN